MKIFIVDDDSDMIEAMTIMLEGAGHQAEFDQPDAVAELVGASLTAG